MRRNCGEFSDMTLTPGGWAWALRAGESNKAARRIRLDESEDDKLQTDLLGRRYPHAGKLWPTDPSTELVNRLTTGWQLAYERLAARSCVVRSLIQGIILAFLQQGERRLVPEAERPPRERVGHDHPRLRRLVRWQAAWARLYAAWGGQ